VWETEEIYTWCWWVTLRERDHFQDLDERIILKWIFRELDRGMDWIDLAEYRDGWRALVSGVMNLRVP
jgi:hypothetical protein